MDYKVISSHSPESLSNRVSDYIKEGWKPVGSHQVVELLRQNKFRGDQHMSTLIESEYSQTIIKDNE